ncbi:MAG: FtsX-like permease family protein [Nitrospira sp.]|nr:ABC transporter permease [Candidatus Manganitrophaceae bacterium]HIL34391.1 ABC transporter permease [Candidatus Manganitrophaceae bacterium]
MIRVLLQSISLRHLLHERRTWLTLVGVALGIAVFISIRLANKSVLETYQKSVDLFAGNTTLEIIGRGGAIDEMDLVEIRKVPGVISIAPIVQSVLPMASPSSAKGEVLLLMGIDLLQETPFRSYEVRGAEGEAFDALIDPAAVFLTVTFAERHRIQVGDHFSVRKEEHLLDLHVAGLLEAEGVALGQDGNIAVMDIASAQWTLGKLGKLDRIDLITDEEAKLDEIIESFGKRLGGRLLIRRPEQRSRQVEKMLFSFQLNLTALSAISLFVGVFLIYNTLLVSVVHRRKEIGILRALGVPRSKIFWLFTLEGIMIGTAGGFAGVFAGALLGRWVIQILSQTVSALYVPIPPSPFSLPLSLIVEGMGIGAFVATLSSLFPALQAARLKPRESMEGIYHNQRGVKQGLYLGAGLIAATVSFFLSQVPSEWGLQWARYLSAGFLLMAFSLIVPAAILVLSRSLRPFLSGMPPSWRMAQGHLEQALRRNAPTISAFMGALAMMMSVVIMIESFRSTVEVWIDQTIRSDIIGFPVSYMSRDTDETISRELSDEVEAMSGIAAVDRYRSIEIIFRDEPARLVGRDLAIHRSHSRYLFQSGESAEIIQEAIREKKILISEVFANRFDLGVGDKVQLPSPRGGIPLSIGGIFYEYSTDGGKMVIDRSFLEEDWDDQEIDVLAIYLKEGESADAVRQTLVQKWGSQYGLAFTTQVDFKEEVLEIFDQTFLITYALEWIAVVVALLGITNTLFVSVLERRREIGLLRAIGGSRRQVIQVVLIEAFYMGLIGWFLALFCAFFLSLLLILVINKESFGWTILLHFPPYIVLHAFILATVTALLAGFFPAWKAAKMNITEAIAYE